MYALSRSLLTCHVFIFLRQRKGTFARACERPLYPYSVPNGFAYPVKYDISVRQITSPASNILFHILLFRIRYFKVADCEISTQIMNTNVRIELCYAILIGRYTPRINTNKIKGTKYRSRLVYTNAYCLCISLFRI